jgi:signal transduction histidine kinase
VTTKLWAGPEHVGDLVVALPSDQLQLAPATRSVLGLIAAPLAQALHAVRLSEQVQASRGRVIAALEDERRRMRRDLHDGLGPTLTGIAYSADAASNLVSSDADGAAQVLRELRSDAAEAIVEIRRIVHGLRPKALDELGLVAAVEQRVSRLRAADGRMLQVEITAPDTLPELPAALEVVAYRVAVEAVTNVARHSGVAAALVTFTVTPGQALRRRN